MAAVVDGVRLLSSHENENMDDLKHNELETMMDRLMDRLRIKSRCQLTSVDAIKTFNLPSDLKESCEKFHACNLSHMLCVQDKKKPERYEILALHKHMDCLERYSAVVNRANTFDRLESIARQTRVKLVGDDSKRELSFTCGESFSLRLSLAEDNAGVTNISFCQNSENKPCTELMKSLKRGDYEELQRHLEGLVCSYDIDGDKKTKVKAVQALQSLESDLNMLSKFQSTIASVQSYIHKSPLGVVTSRNLGLPMKLTYFVGPFDLLNHKTRSMTPLTIEAILDSDVGFSLTVGIESSSALRRLQITPLLTTTKNLEGKSLPSFGGLTNYNSAYLSAQFVLQLKSPLVLSATVISSIKQLTGIEFVQATDYQSILSLLLMQTSQGCKKERKNEEQLNTRWHSVVRLPDQSHRYFFDGCRGFPLQGALISRIPFIHPTNVPSIIILLRQQVLFNTIMLSCIRRPTTASAAKDDALTFEVTPLSMQNLTITFEHPFQDSLVTVDVDLMDITCVKCRMIVPDDGLICPDEFATRVFQRSLSLPILLRAIWRKASPELQKKYQSPHLHLRMPLISRLPGWRQLARMKMAEWQSQSNKSQQLMAFQKEKNRSGNCQIEMHRHDQVLCNPMLASLLDQSAVCGDFNFNLSCSSASSFSGPSVLGRGGDKGGGIAGPVKQPRKRQAESPISVGHSPKRKPKEDQQYNIVSSTPARLPINPALLVTPISHAVKQERLGSPAGRMGPRPLRPELASTAQLMKATIVKGDRITLNTSSSVNSSADGGRIGGCIQTQNNCSRSIIPVLPAKQDIGHWTSSTERSVVITTLAQNLKSKASEQMVSNPELTSILSDSPTPKLSSAKPAQLSKDSEYNSVSKDRRSPAARKMNASPIISSASSFNSHSACSSSSSFSSSSSSVFALETSDTVTVKQEPTVFSLNAISNKTPFNARNSSPRRQLASQADSVNDVNKEMMQSLSNGQLRPNVASEQEEFKDRVSVGLEIKPEPIYFKVARNKSKNEGPDNVSAVSNQRFRDSAGSSSVFEESGGNKPPIKVKLSRRTILKDPSLDASSSSPDATMWKERTKEERRLHGGSSKLSLSLSDITSDLSADSEVDGLTSGVIVGSKVTGLPPSGRCSSSPRLIKTSLGGQQRVDPVRPSGTEKRPRIEKEGLEIVEKKPKKGDESGKKPVIKRPPSNLSSSSSVDRVVPPSTAKVSTIKISNYGGKLTIQNPVKSTSNSVTHKSVAVRSIPSSSSSHTTSITPRGSKPPPSSVLLPKAVRPGNLSIRGMSRMKSDFTGRRALSGSKVVDQKLNRTPTVKLKHVVVTSAAPSGSTANTVSSSSTQLTKPSPGTTASSHGGRNRLGSKGGALLVVIDNLMKKQHTTSTTPGGGGTGDGGGSATVGQKELYDAIRLEIIREGNKPSTPTRENTTLVKSTGQQLQKKGDPGRSDTNKGTTDGRIVMVTSQATTTTLVTGKTTSTQAKSSGNGLQGRSSATVQGTKVSTGHWPASIASSGTKSRTEISSALVISQPRVSIEPLFTNDLPGHSVALSATVDRLKPSSTLVNVSAKSCDTYSSSQTPDPAPDEVLSISSSSLSSSPTTPTPSKGLPSHLPSHSLISSPSPGKQITTEQGELEAGGAGDDTSSHHSKLGEVPDRHFMDAVVETKPPSSAEEDCMVERLLSPPRSPSPLGDDCTVPALGSSGLCPQGSGPLEPALLRIVDFSKGSPITVEDSESSNQTTEVEGGSQRNTRNAVLATANCEADAGEAFNKSVVEDAIAEQDWISSKDKETDSCVSMLSPAVKSQNPSKMSKEKDKSLCQEVSLFDMSSSPKSDNYREDVNLLEQVTDSDDKCNSSSEQQEHVERQQGAEREECNVDRSEGSTGEEAQLTSEALLTNPNDGSSPSLSEKPSSSFSSVSKSGNTQTPSMLAGVTFSEDDSEDLITDDLDLMDVALVL